MRTRGFMRLAIALAVGASGLSLTATPARADTVIFDDAGGDADGRADIISFGADYDGAGIAVAAWVAEPTDPFSDPNWTQSDYSYVVFGVDTDGDLFLDYSVYLYTLTDGSPYADVRGADGESVCDGVPTFEDGFYAVGIDASCIGSPASFYMNVAVRYDTDVNDPAAPVVRDFAPDGAEEEGSEGAWAGPITGVQTDPLQGTELVERVAGFDRIDTAVAVSQSGFQSGRADAVVLATAFNYPDALVGVPLAAHHAGPLLLTYADRLDPSVAEEIQRVLPAGSTVYLLGGQAVLSNGVADAVRDLGYQADRLAGVTRYETAVRVAEHIGDPSRILLATGLNFPDALAAGSAAAAYGGVLLLTEGTTMPAVTAAYINGSSAPRTAVGDPAAQADPQALPIRGADRYETAVRVATQFFGSGFYTGGGFGLASGRNFPDALSGGARVAVFGGPVLLTPPDQLAERVRTYLQNNAHNYSFGYAFGGTAAISDGVRAAAQSAIAG